MKIEAKFKSVLVYEFTEYNGCRGHVDLVDIAIQLSIATQGQGRWELTSNK